MIRPAGILVGAASIVGPGPAAFSLLSAIRAGHSSDDWAERVRFGAAPDEFERAVSAWKKKGVIPNDVWQLLEPFFKSQSFSLAGQWNTDFLDELFASLSEALFEQRTVKEWLEEADTIFRRFGAAMNRPWLYDGPEPKPHYADMVFRTNQSSFNAAGTYAETFSRKWIQAAPFWLYSAINDDRTREEHAALDGRVFRKDDSTARLLLPPASWNCFPGDAPVSGRFSAGFKAWYDGELVELVTRRGHRLTVTRNHPVLTSGGFVLAHDIKEGDRLVCYEGRGEDGLDAGRAHEAVSLVPGTNQRPLLHGDDHVQDRPASIEEVFEALRLMGGGLVRPLAPDDFYGDAVFGKGEVEVVATSRELLDRIGATRAKGVADLGLPVVDEQDATVPGGSGLHESVEGSLPSGDGSPSGPALALDGSSIRLERGPLDPLGLALPSDSDTEFGERSAERRSADAALVGEALQGLAGDVPAGEVGQPGDGLAVALPGPGERFALRPLYHSVRREGLEDTNPRDAEGFAQGVNGVPGGVALDEVVLVNRSAFHGHVFDLQSPYGWILSGGIFTSNCRCQSIELDEQDVEDGGYHVSKGADIPPEDFPPPEWRTDRVEALVPSFLRDADLEPKEDVN